MADPISGIEGGVVGIGPITETAGKLPTQIEGAQELAGMLRGSSDEPVSPLVGSEGGAPIYGLPAELPIPPVV